jgi:D-3-phosphoglycerate dehydrogenase/C-terminal binding protein
MKTPSYTVAVTDFITDSLEPEREVLGDLADVRALNASSEGDLVGRIEQADALMLYHSIALTAATIRRLTRCKVIVRCGVGYDNIDNGAARSAGIPVCNVPDYGTEEVADAAIGMTLALTRGISFLNSRLRANVGTWTYLQAAPLLRLRGQVFGIVGLGRIGTATALRARALGMNVHFHDPYKPDGYDKALDVRRVRELTELLEKSFVLSLHCPLTAETQNLINGQNLSRMPRGSYLVNTARGGLVEGGAVIDAIAAGQLAGAALDVLPTEPPGADDPLILAWRNPAHAAHHRLILNPHTAFYSEQGLLDMRLKGAQTCRAALLGQRLSNVVNGCAPQESPAPR